MYNFMIERHILLADGEVDARAPLAAGGYYLLDGNGRVLLSNSALQKPATGEDFFAALGTVKGESTVLMKTLLHGAREPYLMQCGKTPVLVLRALYAGNLTLFAAIPPEDVGEALRHPAAYRDILGFPLALSPLSLAADNGQSERDFLLMRDWLQRVAGATAGAVLRRENAPALATVLRGRLGAIARFSGCLLQYDLSALSFGTVLGVDDALLSATLFAVCFALTPHVRDRALHIAAHRDSLGEPTLHIRFYADFEAPPTLLTSLLAALQARAMTWECYRDGSVEGLWHFTLPMCAKELSLQQLRNFFGYQ